jgi:hypothetical protein
MDGTTTMMTMDDAVRLLEAAGMPARAWVKRFIGQVREARIYIDDGLNPFNRCTGWISADRKTLTVSIAAVDAAIAARK